jgi:hypothetical protein
MSERFEGASSVSDRSRLLRQATVDGDSGLPRALVQPVAADPERVLLALVAAGDVPVERDRDAETELARRSSSLSSPC